MAGTLGRTLERAQTLPIELNFIMDKEGYFPEERVEGKVYLVTREAIRITRLILVMEGYNAVYWEENTRQKAYSEDVKLFEERLLIRSFANIIPAGRYSFDFTYGIPSFLPASFSLYEDNKLRWDDILLREANVRYTMKAMLERDDRPIGPEIKKPIVVHPSCETTSSVIKKGVAEPVKAFWLFRRGNMKIRIQVDKPTYCRNDIMKTRIEITNLTSLNCEKIVAVLFRKLKMLAQRSQRNIRTKEYTLEFQPVPPGEKAVFKRDIDFRKLDIFPTTNSRNIKCTYFLAVRCDMPYATSVETWVPVTVIMEADEISGDRFPPDQLYKPWKD